MKNNKQLRAVITGVCGQDGSFLSELLLSKNYDVYGISRRKSVNQGTENIKHLIGKNNFNLIDGDITDSTLISRVLHDIKPHEYYNLGAQSHVGYSFVDPLHTFNVTGQSVIMQLEMIRQYSPSTRFLQASTSEMMGGIDCPKTGYNEQSQFHPRSPYAVAKAAAYYAVQNYREAYGLHASNIIMFNHSSERRGLDFATRKITHGVASIKHGLQEYITMGNINAFRDEGHAKDFVEGMFLMLQQDLPDDYVIATGENASIRQMLEYVCNQADLKLEDVYKQDEKFMRPSDVPFLLGDASKAKKILGWSPKYSWKKLLREMYQHDFDRLNKDD